MGQDFDSGLPSTRQLQTLIRSQQAVELKLTTGDIFHGQLRWQDPHCLGITTAEQGTVQVWMHAVAYIKPQ